MMYVQLIFSRGACGIRARHCRQSNLDFASSRGGYFYYWFFLLLFIAEFRNRLTCDYYLKVKMSLIDKFVSEIASRLTFCRAPLRLGRSRPHVTTAVEDCWYCYYCCYISLPAALRSATIVGSGIPSAAVARIAR